MVLSRLYKAEFLVEYIYKPVIVITAITTINTINNIIIMIIVSIEVLLLYFCE
jgi:hypothetical protein